MESVILEANRLRSIDQNGDTSIDEFNNRWTNSVSTTGIEVKAGDIVSIESAAINAKGNEVEDTMEFRGDTIGGFKDNELTLKYEYYVNHTGDYTIPLPFTKDLTFNGREVSTSHADNYLVANSNNLKCRQIGEWSPTNVPIDPRVATNPPTAVPTDYKTNPQFYFFYPLVSGLTGVVSQEKGGYEAGQVYDIYFTASNPQGYQTTGVFLKVLTTRDEGTTTGIIDTWTIQRIDANDFYLQTWYYQLSNPLQTNSQQTYYISSTTNPTTPTQNSTIGIVWKNPKTFTKRKDMLPDGSRFYKGQTNFLGWGLNNCAGIANGLTDYFDISPYSARSLAGFTDEIGDFSTWTTANTEVKLSVPNGFSTPTDIAGTLTDQLHSAQLITPNKAGQFVDVGNFDYQDTNINPATGIPLVADLPPTLVDTPTFKQITAGFDNECANPPIDNVVAASGEIENTYQDQYRIWYNSVYWKDPNRVEALSPFRQFFYGLDNTDVRNGINSGANQVALTGDFKTQEIGELGLLPRLLSKFGVVSVPATANNPAYDLATSNNQRFYPLRTNIKYTEANVIKIAAMFKKCEENRNTDTGLPVSAGGVLPNTPIGDPSKLDTTNMAVLLDIGHYVDEQSQSGELNNFKKQIYQGSYTGQASQFQDQKGFMKVSSPDQRNKFATAAELTGTYTYVSTTKTRITPPSGAPDAYGQNALYDARTFQMGDGQELPQIWVQSRWRDGLQARQMTPLRDTSIPSFSDAVEDMMDFNTGGVDMPYLLGFTPQDFPDRFERSFTSGGVLYSYDQYIKWAIDADVALMPYFADAADANFGADPYIAFMCFDRIGNNTGGGDFFPTRPQVIENSLLPVQEFIGFDCSFTRNKAVFFQNTQNHEAMATTRYGEDNNGVNQTIMFEAAPMAMIGAVDPVVNFDAIKSRFEFKGLSTPLTIGNPFLSNPVFGAKTATDNPEQQIYSVGRQGTNYFIFTSSIGNLLSPAIPESTYGANIFQKQGTIMDAYSGISIVALIIPSATSTATTELNDYSKANEFVFTNTLFNKMGFELAQLLPPFGDIQARFDNALFTDPLTQTLQNTPRIVKPLTTGAFISSAEYQPSATDMNRFPLYGLGTAQQIQAEPSVQTASILAKNLPSKLDFPYLMVYTNLGMEMLYYGGEDAHSRLPCLAYISRNYSAGDFFYLPAGTFSLQVSRDFVLTDITTDIRLPDGSRPKLSPHSSVIYKIVRAPVQQAVQTAQTSRQQEQKTEQQHKKMLLNNT